MFKAREAIFRTHTEDRHIAFSSFPLTAPCGFQLLRCEILKSALAPLSFHRQYSISYEVLQTPPLQSFFHAPFLKCFSTIGLVQSSIFFISRLISAFSHPSSILYVNRLTFRNTTLTMSSLYTNISLFSYSQDKFKLLSLDLKASTIWSQKIFSHFC